MQSVSKSHLEKEKISVIPIRVGKISCFRDSRVLITAQPPHFHNFDVLVVLYTNFPMFRDEAIFAKRERSRHNELMLVKYQDFPEGLHVTST